jgi:hypothetical protein
MAFTPRSESLRTVWSDLEQSLEHASLHLEVLVLICADNGNTELTLVILTPYLVNVTQVEATRGAVRQRAG